MEKDKNMKEINQTTKDFMIETMNKFNVNTKIPYIALQKASNDIDIIYYDYNNLEISFLDISEIIIEDHEIINVYGVETTFIERYENGKYLTQQPCLIIRAINKEQNVLLLATYTIKNNKIIYDKITTHFLGKTEQSLGDFIVFYDAFFMRK